MTNITTTSLPPDLSARRRTIEDGIFKAFINNGCREVITPSLEPASLYSGYGGGIPDERLVKTIDADGRTLALRPDFTIPIARFYAARMREEALPVKLCYVGDVFAFGAGRSGGAAEIRQTGVEWIGIPEGPAGDAAIILLAIEALRSAGLKSFQLEIGQVGFFKGLIEEAGFSPDTAERLRRLVEMKNMLDLQMLLGRSNASAAIAERLLSLPGLYGGAETLDEASRLSQNPSCQRAVDNLRGVLDAIDKQGMSEYVSVDLGMVHSIHYYTGITFRGMAMGVGAPLLSGGRYDSLVSAFGGGDVPATGFAIEVNALMTALESNGGER